MTGPKDWGPEEELRLMLLQLGFLAASYIIPGRLWLQSAQL